ncbi:MAG: hypothetical protein DCC57_19960 [Chloroflexi bacterium]|nr:MAG: hypothetical protein DCC57_19960 [Chloroflexota bacterium]
MLLSMRRAAPLLPNRIANRTIRWKPSARTTRSNHQIEPLGGQRTMTQQISRRGFLRMSGALATVGVLAACAPTAAPQAQTGEGGAAPGGDTVNLKWDTFRAPGTGWNEERIETFKESHPNVNIAVPASRTTTARCMPSTPPAIWATSSPLTPRISISGAPSTSRSSCRSTTWCRPTPPTCRSGTSSL